MIPTLTGFIPDRQYSLIWFDPVTGKWQKPLTVRTDAQGSMNITSFPDSQDSSVTDWALKIKKH